MFSGNYPISDITKLMTFVSEHSIMNTYALINRKADICTWKDRVKERDIDFLLDLNTDHTFYCNCLLYVDFVIDDTRKSHLLFSLKQLDMLKILQTKDRI